MIAIRRNTIINPAIMSETETQYSSVSPDFLKNEFFMMG
jgi:hypothetical protein